MLSQELDFCGQACVLVSMCKQAGGAAGEPAGRGAAAARAAAAASKKPAGDHITPPNDPVSTKPYKPPQQVRRLQLQSL